MFRLLDRIAEWVQHGVDTEAQQRLAVACILLSIPLAVIGPLLSSAPAELLIYEMSALAITLTGITWLAGLSAKRATEEQQPVAPPPPVP